MSIAIWIAVVVTTGGLSWWYGAKFGASDCAHQAVRVGVCKFYADDKGYRYMVRHDHDCNEHEKLDHKWRV